MAGAPLGWVTAGELHYPPHLKFLPAMPRRLYYRGRLPGTEPAVAIVGSRRCTAYGREQAAYFAEVFAAHGVAVISGMAAGIDAAAQSAALDAGGLSFGVLGCGADVCYPPSEKELYLRLASSGGLLSEFEPGSDPISWHFPIRNRVISGLSDAVLVIEARPRSGSLITANFALEQGRTVYALPGRVTDAYSEGCNELIAQGASVALSPEVILEGLKLQGCAVAGRARGDGGEPVSRDSGDSPSAASRDRAADGEPEDDTGGGRKPIALSSEALLIKNMLTEDPLSLNEIISRSDLDPASGAAAIAELLQAGEAEEAAFHFYVRARKRLARP